MKKVFALLAVAALATTTFAQPSLVGSSVALPGGLTGWTISVNWGDASTASGYFDLDAASTGIQHQQPFAGFDINDLFNANTFDPFATYDKTLDSYWLVGNGTPWTTAAPPENGVNLPSGFIGSDLYKASYGTATTTPVSGTTGVLYLVTSEPNGTLNVNGVVSRLGRDYPVDVTFSNAPQNPEISAAGGDAGNVRVGTSGGLSASVANVGAGTLNGSFPVAGGEFSGGGSAFSLAGGASQNEAYGYTPSARGPDSVNLPVASNGGAASITLAGTGVGPEFADDDADDCIDVGNVFFGSPSGASFTISNNGDLGLGGLSDLTITGVSIVGSDGNILWSTDLAAGTVIPAGGSQLVNVLGGYAGIPQVPGTATLVLNTDQGAALGGDGADFSFQLKGFAVPEPSTIALAAFGALGLVGFALRRRAA